MKAPATTLLLLLLPACLPDVESDLARVDAPRILAIRSDPAEVVPGETTQLTALYADAAGTIAAAPLEWALCTARRPLAELGSVATDCLAATDDTLTPAGTGLTITTPLPADACRLFGPDPPPNADGMPAGRPVDPDRTGGYYQPIRVQDPDDPDAQTLLRIRIACGLAGATQQQAAQYRQQYLANVPPAVITLTADDLPVTTDLTVPADTTIELRATWAECPDTAECGDALCSPGEPGECPDDCTPLPGCPGAEQYLRFDPTTLDLTTQREAIGAAWYATDGIFKSQRTGRASDDRASFTTNTWTAPTTPGPQTLWIVLRDDRGASSWRALDIIVTP